MHGCKLLWLLILFSALTGFIDSAATEKKEATASQAIVLGEGFDEASTGIISGTVSWQGTLPQIPSFKVFGLPGDYPIDVRQNQPNPNWPRIQAETLAMADAMVFLRKVDVRKSRPWDHPNVRIEQKDRRLIVRQGEASCNVGWVRAGDMIELTNLDEHFHLLRGRGGAFFSLPFPKPNLPSHRRLDQPGLVELSSGAFFFWMHGYLLVEQHPYFARTNAQGKFILQKVPAGSYDVVCWMPSWEVAQKKRDPETGLIIQVDFQSPIERVQTLTVGSQQRTEASYTWSLRDF